MSNVINPLQALIKSAAQTLPTQTGAVDRFRARHEAAGPRVIIADVSMSMASLVGSRPKIDVLREAATDLRKAYSCRLITFSDVAVVDAETIGPPSGSTALHLALDAAIALRPCNTLVISDGEPNDAALALACAEKLSGLINTLYIGSESNRSAIEFMQALARRGCGEYRHNALRSVPVLTNDMRLLLGAK